MHLNQNHKHHSSITSISSSISSIDLHSNTSSHTSFTYKRYSELMPTRRWDDSQLEMELAEDDLIEEQRKKKFINSSLRLKLSENLKFRHSHSNSNNTPLFKRLYSWFT
ncbi:hypothetical protein BCV72DRAFT_246199 [Rhizopus microsporus var. microsporus]|uniref:Uncharacterized protein n=2 Tax=Rhizopus microsporus TaxID=58291 RepID=A0A2G4SP13_RHIZD|nr:uncharacterized protein RHIMIDRAFT_245025 [Rhizopus microsporus ATCC 52813]ORE01088.1 hypothetical protein BCV72DRAFT_246199 [Rhizopus microsporus var. microsporus]PHZ10503.1 hypothetical protein RHIMIDRAFT_245025 [Rhizopus microsporus ATCC 52813]